MLFINISIENTKRLPAKARKSYAFSITSLYPDIDTPTSRGGLCKENILFSSRTKSVKCSRSDAGPALQSLCQHVG